MGAGKKTKPAGKRPPAAKAAEAKRKQAEGAAKAAAEVRAMRASERRVAESEAELSTANESLAAAKADVKAKTAALAEATRALRSTVRDGTELPLFKAAGVDPDTGALDGPEWRRKQAEEIGIGAKVARLLTRNHIGLLGGLNDYLDAGGDLARLDPALGKQSAAIRAAVNQYWAEHSKERPEPAWRRTTLAAIKITGKPAELLASYDLADAGKLIDYLRRPGNHLADIKGLGEQGIEAVERALAGFMKECPAANPVPQYPVYVEHDKAAKLFRGTVEAFKVERPDGEFGPLVSEGRTLDRLRGAVTEAIKGTDPNFRGELVWGEPVLKAEPAEPAADPEEKPAATTRRKRGKAAGPALKLAEPVEAEPVEPVEPEDGDEQEPDDQAAE